MSKQEKKLKLSIRDVAMIGVMVAVIVVSKEILSFLPNIELVSFWIIMFTLFFGWRILFVVPVFVFVEGFIYGMGIWWIMYLYAWPLLALLAYLNKKQESVWFWSLLSSVFGLFFGLLCIIPYVVIGMTNGGIQNGLRVALPMWVSGIPFDIIHCVGNFVVMLILYKPVRTIMMKIQRMVF